MVIPGRGVLEGGGVGGRGGGGPTWVITGAGGASTGSADRELAF